METSRDDVGIAIRSAFLSKGAQQRFSLFALIVLSIFLLFFERIDAKPLNYVRSFVKDVIFSFSLTNEDTHVPFKKLLISSLNIDFEFSAINKPNS